MESIDVLARSAQQLRSLASEPGLHIESSPGAHRLLRACLTDIERATGELSHTLPSVVPQKNLQFLYLAVISDSVTCLKETLSALEDARPLSDTAKKILAGVGDDLLAVTQDIQNTQALPPVAEKRQEAKVIPFPQDRIVRRDAANTGKANEAVPLSESNGDSDAAQEFSMPRYDEIIALIAEKKRRLQYLKLLEARKGYNTPPEVLIEIEDIEKEIKQLEREAEELGAAPAPPPDAKPAPPSQVPQRLPSEPTDLYNRIRDALMECPEFDSDQTLLDFFAHPDLKPWRNVLRQTSDRNSRVQGVLARLRNQRRVDGRHALVILLSLLGGAPDPETELQERLLSLADELTDALQAGKW